MVVVVTGIVVVDHPLASVMPWPTEQPPYVPVPFLNPPPVHWW